MLRAYNLRTSRAKFSLRASSPIWASAVSLARTHERVAKPRGAEEIGELARWLGKVRRLARLHALLLPAPYIFLVFSMHITRETMSSNLIIIFYLILLTTKQITFWTLSLWCKGEEQLYFKLLFYKTLKKSVLFSCLSIEVYPRAPFKGLYFLRSWLMVWSTSQWMNTQVTSHVVHPLGLVLLMTLMR